MARYEDCVRSTLKAAGRDAENVTDDALNYVERIHSEIDAAYKEVMARTKKPAKEALSEAAQALATKKKIVALQKKQAMLKNAETLAQTYKEISRIVDPKTGFVDRYNGILEKMTGGTSGRAGTNESIHVLQYGVLYNTVQPLMAEIEKIPGLSKILEHGDRTFDENLHQEMWRVLDPNIPSTKDKLAERTAQFFFNAKETSRRMANDSGAQLGQNHHHAMNQTHDPVKIAADGFETWSAYMKENLSEATLERLQRAGERDKVDIFKEIYLSMVTGVHEVASGKDFLSSFRGPGNLAKKMSEARVLEFKSPKAAYEYHMKYGRGTVAGSMIENLVRMSRNIALMKAFGTNPEAGLRHLVERSRIDARNAGDIDGARAFGSFGQPNTELMGVFHDLTGEAARPGGDPNIYSEGSKLVKNVNSFGSLGFAMFGSLSDVAGQTARLLANGVPRMAAWFEGLSAPINMLTGPSSKEARLLSGVAIDSFIRRLTLESKAQKGIIGMSSNLAEWTHKYSGLDRWVREGRGTIGDVLMSHLANNAHLPFDSLHPELKMTLGQYGLGGEIWDVMRTHGVDTVDGKRYLNPAKLRDLKAEVIDPLIQPKIDQLTTALKDSEAKALAQQAREDSWITTRSEKLKAEIEKTAERIKNQKEKLEGKADKNIEADELRYEKLSTAYEHAVAKGELARETRTHKTQNAVRKFLDDVEMGKNAKDIANYSDARLTRDFGAESVSGIKLGRKLRAIEDKLKDVDSRIVAAEKHPEEQVSKAIQAAGERFAKKMADLDEFTEKLGKIQEQRQTGLTERAGRLAPAIEKLRQRTRDDLVAKYAGYLNDQANWGMMEAAPIDRFRTTLDTRSGTPFGAAVRLFMQFKQFSATFARRGIGEQLFRYDKVNYGGVASMLAATTLLGYASLAITEAVKGKGLRTPENYSDAWKLSLAAMMRGGGLSIYGDFLFSNYNRHGNSLAGTLSGPTIAKLEKAIKIVISENIYPSDSQKSHRAAELVTFLRGNAPVVNMWFAKVAMDQLIFNRLQEYLDPGSTSRMVERWYKENKQRPLAIADPRYPWF